MYYSGLVNNPSELIILLWAAAGPEGDPPVGIPKGRPSRALKRALTNPQGTHGEPRISRKDY